MVAFNFFKPNAKLSILEALLDFEMKYIRLQKHFDIIVQCNPVSGNKSRLKNLHTP